MYQEEDPDIILPHNPDRKFPGNIKMFVHTVYQSSKNYVNDEVAKAIRNY